MTCEFVFLPVGNADSMIIYPDGGSAIVIDLHQMPLLRKWFENRKENKISRIYITHEHKDHFPSLEKLVTFLEHWLKSGTVGTLCLPYEVYKDAKKKVVSDPKKLLETIDPEIAVLSVGSNNNYGHVVPDLFSLLLSLKNDTSKRLRNFVCTDVTRTCVNSASERSSMGRSGLSKQQLCAGEITILAETSGQWKLKTQTVHEDIISSLPRAACKGKADLGIIST